MELMPSLIEAEDNNVRDTDAVRRPYLIHGNLEAIPLN
jgi:hypothetical protein